MFEGEMCIFLAIAECLFESHMTALFENRVWQL